MNSRLRLPHSCDGSSPPPWPVCVLELWAAVYVIASISRASSSQYKLIRRFLCESLCSRSFQNAVKSKWLFPPRSVCSFMFSFPFFCLRIPPGPDHGDDDRVLPLHLHHAGKWRARSRLTVAMSNHNTRTGSECWTFMSIIPAVIHNGWMDG